MDAFTKLASAKDYTGLVYLLNGSARDKVPYVARVLDKFMHGMGDTERVRVFMAIKVCPPFPLYFICIMYHVFNLFFCFLCEKGFINRDDQNPFIEFLCAYTAPTSYTFNPTKQFTTLFLSESLTVLHKYRFTHPPPFDNSISAALSVVCALVRDGVGLDTALVKDLCEGVGRMAVNQNCGVGVQTMFAYFVATILEFTTDEETVSQLQSVAAGILKWYMGDALRNGIVSPPTPIYFWFVLIIFF